MNSLVKITAASIVVVLIACGSVNDMEQSMKLMDLDHHEEFIKQLDLAGIPFRVASDRQVFYSSRNAEDVREISKSVLGISGDQKVRGVTVPATLAPEVALRLTEKKIPFEVLYDGDRTMFTWPANLNETAQSYVMEVLEDNGA